MDTKSHDELNTVLINSVETLTKRIEKLEDQLKKNTEMQTKSSVAIQELNTTVTATNKVFEQVSTGVTALYEKVKSFEALSKIIGNLGNLAPLLGGLGGLGGGPKK